MWVLCLVEHDPSHHYTTARGRHGPKLDDAGRSRQSSSRAGGVGGGHGGVLLVYLRLRRGYFSCCESAGLLVVSRDYHLHTVAGLPLFMLLLHVFIYLHVPGAARGGARVVVRGAGGAGRARGVAHPVADHSPGRAAGAGAGCRATAGARGDEGAGEDGVAGLGSGWGLIR